MRPRPLFEPDVRRQASPQSASPLPPTGPSLHSSSSQLLGQPSGYRPATHAGADRCCAPSPPHRRPLLSPAVLLHLSPHGIPPSINSPLSSRPSVFTPPSSLGLLPLSALLRGKEPCVCCLAACRLLSSNPPLLFSYLKLPSSSSFFLSLIPRCTSSSPPFLSSATFSSYLPLSPSLSPPASNHSPLHLFFTPGLHSYSALHLSLPPFLPRSLPHLFPRLGSGAVNRCCLLLIWVRSD